MQSGLLFSAIGHAAVIHGNPSPLNKLIHEM